MTIFGMTGGRVDGGRITGFPAAMLAAALLCSWPGGPAAAQPLEPGPPEGGTVILSGAQGDRMALEAARRKLAEERHAEAYEILLILERRRPEERDLQVLIAQVEVALGRPEAAIARMEVQRDRHPDWPRPRVELALAHVAAGHIRTAKALLVAALGENPPEHVRRNIEAAIRQLEDQQIFVGRVDVGVAPDSNITGGTYNDTVNYFGLPFTLNDDAKQQEGVRGTISAGGTVRTPWDRNSRMEFGVDATHSEPLGDKGTPSSNVRAELAVRLRGPNGSLRTGFAVQPYLWDNELQRVEHGIFTEGGWAIGDTQSLTGSLTLTEGNVAQDALRDFRHWETSLGPTFALGETTSLQTQAVFGIRDAEDELYSFLRRGLSFRLASSPANGWRATLAGSLTLDTYRDFSVFFGTTQEDFTTAANLQVVRTGWVFFGVSPSLDLGYSETRSTIDLYDRRSISISLGLALPY